ncbi:MAG TPA: carbon storage regulator [Bryobacteraceae bacterium]|nr:carbon storage regulator [Bryobacteraceae bacterium]
MLMMSRREGETILIGDEIEIVIAHIGRSRVKVGIRAPRQMLVIAREVKLVREENLAAAWAGAEIGLDSLRKFCPTPQVFPDRSEEVINRQEAGPNLERIPS